MKLRLQKTSWVTLELARKLGIERRLDPKK